MRLLIIEDERTLCDAVSKSLEKDGFEVDVCYTGAEALEKTGADKYDLIILDLNLPRMDGMDILKKLRLNDQETKVLILSARGNAADKIAGLDAGANDYLVKPFAFEELLARIRVLLRKPAEAPSNCLQTANLKLLLDTHQVFRGDTEIHLSGKEFSLLRYLMQNEGIVLSRDKLEQHIWNYDFTGGSNVINVYIRYLRRKIDDGFEPKLIHTVRGAGYVLKVAI